MRAAFAFLCLLPCARLQDWRSEVDALLARNELDTAIERLETHLGRGHEDVAAERLLAHTLELRVDAGGSWRTLEDARSAWDHALALAPDDEQTQRGAIAVRLRLGDPAAALALAERALGAAWLEHGSAPAPLLVLACRARIAGLRAAEEQRAAVDPAAGNAAVDSGDLLRPTWAALTHARSLAPADTELVLLAAALLEAEGLPERAAAELRAALERAPAAAELHRALAELSRRAGVEERLPALYERWSGAGTNATLAWFTGDAWRAAGDLAQRERRLSDALAAYTRASEWLSVAGTLDPALRETAEGLRYQAQVSATWCELEAGALDAAAERGLGLLRAAPARRSTLDGLGRSLLGALSALHERRCARNDFEHAALAARVVVTQLASSAAAPEASAASGAEASEKASEEGAWYAALGSALRAQATQVAAGVLPGSEREARARALYREAWQAYQRAVALVPADARVANDAALVQVQHLRDNLAEAETLLVRAGELAEAQLAALGENPREEQRFPLAAVLADAHTNLGYLCYHVYRQPERARSEFERARAAAGGERPVLDEYLAALDGRRGPVPEPVAEVGAPASSAAGASELSFEASLAEAEARARSEGRALLVYERGRALGPAIAGCDAFLRSTAFAAHAQELVLLLCDAERLTFVDRRRDGRRVPCPRFGDVTCGEHGAAELEFASWFRTRFGAEPGAAAEGFWLLRPGAEELVRVDDLAALTQLGGAPSSADALAPGSFGAIEANLGGDDGGGEARALVAIRSLAARTAVERVLWDGFRSSPARSSLLGALSADGGPAARELLGACVRQDGDPELARAALLVWPAGLELAPVRHAASWSEDAAVRAAALAVLARESPNDAAARARAVLDAPAGGG